MTAKKTFDFCVRLGWFEFHAFYNRSLKQVQVHFGKRFFEGSQKHSKTFFAIKWKQRDIITMGK